MSGNLLTVNAEAGSSVYNTTTYVCEPNDDALMLRLLNGLIAAILLLYLVNVSQPAFPSFLRQNYTVRLFIDN